MILAKNLSHSKGNKILFRQVNLTIAPGKRVLVQGANGAGKSTLLKIIAGLLSPDHGRVTYQGHPLRHHSAQYFNHMSYLGHQNSLKQLLTPLENLQEMLCLANSRASETDIHDLLDTLGLKAHKEQRCETLSAGECRKVALASVILKKKPLWILDEPFNALDKQSYNQLQTLCQQHLQHGGMILLSCHIGSHHYEGCQVVQLS